MAIYIIRLFGQMITGDDEMSLHITALYHWQQRYIAGKQIDDATTDMMN